MSTAGHVSLAMLSRHSHVLMEAKRRALDEIAARQNTADEKRKADADIRGAGPSGCSISGESAAGNFPSTRDPRGARTELLNQIRPYASWLARETQLKLAAAHHG
jgi:hypothetical protein